MATETPPTPMTDWTVADVLAHFGAIPPERIRMYTVPGTATEEDLLRVSARIGRPCELIDGVLVEKTMGSGESVLALWIAHFLLRFLEAHDLGVAMGADGPLRILPGQVRVPDVSFIGWERLPGRTLPKGQVYAVAPDLAVEVLSPGNTEAEMQRKLHDYFAAGVRLVWYINPATRSARAYTAEDRWVEVDEQGVLSGGDVLPGFELRLGDLFAKARWPAAD